MSPLPASIPAGLSTLHRKAAEQMTVAFRITVTLQPPGAQPVTGTMITLCKPKGKKGRDAGPRRSLFICLCVTDSDGMRRPCGHVCDRGRPLALKHLFGHLKPRDGPTYYTCDVCYSFVTPNSNAIGPHVRLCRTQVKLAKRKDEAAALTASSSQSGFVSDRCLSA